MIDTGVLEGRQTPVVRQALHRLDVGPIGPDRELTAGIHRLPVHQHGAGPTFAAVTADFGAGEIQLVPEPFHQGPAVLHVDAMTDAIHGQADRGTGGSGHRRCGGIRRQACALPHGAVRRCGGVALWASAAGF